MRTKKIILMIALVVSASLMASPGSTQPPDGFGQTIEINTRLHSYLGKPTWLLVVRDIDHGQNIPYMYDFRKGTNFWLALTYSKNYLITVSELVFNPYDKKVKNFCNLESMGRIQRGVSMRIFLQGDLSPNTATYTCNVFKYQEPQFWSQSQQ